MGRLNMVPCREAPWNSWWARPSWGADKLQAGPCYPWQAGLTKELLNLRSTSCKIIGRVAQDHGKPAPVTHQLVTAHQELQRALAHLVQSPRHPLLVLACWFNKGMGICPSKVAWHYVKPTHQEMNRAHLKFSGRNARQLHLKIGIGPC